MAFERAGTEREQRKQLLCAGAGGNDKGGDQGQPDQRRSISVDDKGQAGGVGSWGLSRADADGCQGRYLPGPVKAKPGDEGRRKRGAGLRKKGGDLDDDAPAYHFW